MIEQLLQEVRNTVQQRFEQCDLDKGHIISDVPFEREMEIWMKTRNNQLGRICVEIFRAFDCPCYQCCCVSRKFSLLNYCVFLFHQNAEKLMHHAERFIQFNKFYIGEYGDLESVLSSSFLSTASTAA